MSNILPLYEFTIDPKKKNSGVKAISLVDKPAIESDFQLFAKESKQERYVFADQKTKQMILGLALIPNKKIYRVSKEGDEFNGYFSIDTIEGIRNKFMQEKNTDQVNLQHKDNEYIKDVYLVETFIVKTPEQQQDLKNKNIEAPLGSWAVQYHVDSPELFEEIKAGGYKGFSVEAYLDNLLVINKPVQMNIINKFKALINEFESQENFKDNRIAETGQQITYGKVGEPVKAVSDIKDGAISQSALTDGQYILEDGTIIVVKGGVLIEAQPKPQNPPTPEQINDTKNAINNNEDNQNLQKMSNKNQNAENAYQNTGTAKEYKPVQPPAAQTMENDATPVGTATPGTPTSGLDVKPVKSIGAEPKKKNKKPNFKKIKTSRMKKMNKDVVPATPVKVDESKPVIAAPAKSQTITEVPATPIKLSMEEIKKLSTYERFMHYLNLAKTPATADGTGAAIDPNEPQPTDNLPAGKVATPPVAKPDATPADDTTNSALPEGIVDEPETDDEANAENEQELPITDMDKPINQIVDLTKDGQYNIMVVVENGAITEAGIEMEISQDLNFSKVEKIDVSKFEKEIADLKIKLSEAEKQLIKPIAKPDFGNAPIKTFFTKDEMNKMTPYEKLAIQKGFRVITAK